jgi:YebC/PmpR family DNA-binding regulatory protein
MAGHNKWSKVKRTKAVLDARKGKAFSRVAKEITLAARSGGGDAAMNPRLRTVLLKAREVNMPRENIERSIKKGTGELEGQQIEEFTYEGYGPGGIALVVQIATDNKNRAAADVRSAFTRHGGNLAGNGAVMFQFHHCGQFLVGRGKASEDALLELALEAGADDVKSSDEGFEIICGIHAFDKVAAALESKGIKPESSEIIYQPTSTVPVTDLGQVRLFNKLTAALDELDDVQNVFSNEEIADALAEQAQG